MENNEYFITSAGSSGQVWTSDGSGAGAIIYITSGATRVNGLSDALVEDNSVYTWECAVKYKLSPSCWFAY